MQNNFSVIIWSFVLNSWNILLYIFKITLYILSSAQLCLHSSIDPCSYRWLYWMVQIISLLILAGENGYLEVGASLGIAHQRLVPKQPQRIDTGWSCSAVTQRTSSHCLLSSKVVQQGPSWCVLLHPQKICPSQVFLGKFSFCLTFIILF